MADDPKWMALARQRLFIRAIKSYRDEMGVTRREANDFINQWWIDNCLTPTERLRMAVSETLGRLLTEFLHDRAKGPILVAGERYIYDGLLPEVYDGADVSFWPSGLREQSPEDAKEHAPSFAVLIVTPEELYTPVKRKIRRILEEGVRLLWVVDLENQEIMVHHSWTEMTLRRTQDVLSGEDVLPRFACRVDDLFA